MSLRISVPSLAVLLGACAGSPPPAPAPVTATELEQLRTATWPYRSLEAAIDAGYAGTVAACLVHEHHGAMGYHHTNPQFMDALVDVTRPEILLYERLPSGDYRLNGVEFIVPYRSWPRDSTPPVVLGQAMHREENLQFWYLHVWVWLPNPDGVFANFHPDVQCPHDQRRVFRPSEG